MCYGLWTVVYLGVSKITLWGKSLLFVNAVDLLIHVLSLGWKPYLCWKLHSFSHFFFFLSKKQTKTWTTVNSWGHSWSSNPTICIFIFIHHELGNWTCWELSICQTSLDTIQSHGILTTTVRRVFLAPFHRWENRGSERLSINLP